MPQYTIKTYSGEDRSALRHMQCFQFQKMHMEASKLKKNNSDTLT